MNYETEPGKEFERRFLGQNHETKPDLLNEVIGNIPRNDGAIVCKELLLIYYTKTTQDSENVSKFFERIAAKADFSGVQKSFRLLFARLLFTHQILKARVKEGKLHLKDCEEFLPSNESDPHFNFRRWIAEYAFIAVEGNDDCRKYFSQIVWNLDEPEAKDDPPILMRLTFER